MSRKKWLVLGFSLAAFGVAVLPARASDHCKVTDPTGTPLNVRDRALHIVGTIENGRVVIIQRDGEDRNGKPWSFVATPAGRPIGWVYREFISCY
jgi:hypothetical protein